MIIQGYSYKEIGDTVRGDDKVIDDKVIDNALYRAKQKLKLGRDS
jgi:hypothetical protein